MRLDLNRVNGCAKFIDSYVFYPFYDEISHCAKEHSFIALTAPVIGIVDGAASCIQAVAGIGEAAVKGVGNIVRGALTCNGEALKTGSLQIILGVGVIGAVSLPLITIRTLLVTVGMLTDPKETSSSMARSYEKQVFRLEVKQIKIV